MKYRDLLKEEWDEREPLKNTPSPLDWWGKHELELLKRYTEVKNAPSITTHEAEMLIGANKELSYAIFEYKEANAVLPDAVAKKLVAIISRIQPIDKVFYRGVETESYDERHIMPVQSWSMNIATAKMFGDYIYKTVGPVRGIDISNVFYWHGNLYGNSNGLGDSQAEWFLLDPKKVLI